MMASYADHTQYTQPSLLDFVLNVIRKIPNYIIKEHGTFNIPNPSATDENFAEKWNTDPQRALSFFKWHTAFVSDVEELTSLQGIDKVQPLLEKKLIGKESSNWHQKTLQNIAKSREAGNLKRALGVGG